MLHALTLNTIPSRHFAHTGGFVSYRSRIYLTQTPKRVKIRLFEAGHSVSSPILVEEDARKLRLTGQLDQGIYNALRKGFARIADSIIKTAFEHQYTHEISILSRALKFTNEVSTLSEYLREDEG